LRRHWENPNETPQLSSSAGTTGGISKRRHDQIVGDFRFWHFSDLTGPADDVCC